MGTRGPFRTLGALILALVAGCGAPPTGQSAVSFPFHQFSRVVEEPSPDVVAAAPAVAVRPAPRPVPRPVVLSIPKVRRALLIGIDHASGTPSLQGAVNDARTLEQALLRYGFSPDQTTVLTNSEASRGAILSEIAKLAEVRDDGQVVFMFAGHTRRSGGENQIIAADGRTISASALAQSLGRVRVPMWVAFPTCFAGGFQVPGIVGPGRVVTFASEASQLAYESAGFRKSYLIEYMVARAMLQSNPAETVEEAFHRASAELTADYPSRVPLMDDQFPGGFALGRQGTVVAAEAEPPSRQPARTSSSGGRSTPKPSRPRPTPSPTPYEDGTACSPWVKVGNCRDG